MDEFELASLGGMIESHFVSFFCSSFAFVSAAAGLGPWKRCLVCAIFHRISFLLVLFALSGWLWGMAPVALYVPVGRAFLVSH